MKQNCQKVMIQVTRILEIAIALLLMLAIVTALFFAIKNASGNIMEGSFTLDTFMSSCLMLIVGVEFVKMLILHTPESVMEVLLFVVARYVVMSHSSSLDILFGMISIALIFFIKKYLFTKPTKEEAA